MPVGLHSGQVWGNLIFSLFPSLVDIYAELLLNFHRKVVIELVIVVANKRIRLFDVWCVQLVSRGPFYKEKRPVHCKSAKCLSWKSIIRIFLPLPIFLSQFSMKNKDTNHSEDQDIFFLWWR